MVHNGTEHIIAWFLWAHPNSLYWPIKSSGPNCVCVICNIYIYIYKGKRQGGYPILFLFLFGTEKRLHERTLQSTFFWVLKGKSQLNPGFLSFTNWTHPWTSKEHRNDFLWDQSRSAFLNFQFLLYALMSFMRSCLWFKFFHQLVLEQPWMTFKLQFFF